MRDYEQSSVNIKKVRCSPEIMGYSNHIRVLAKGSGNLLYDVFLLKELGKEYHGLRISETSGSGWRNSERRPSLRKPWLAHLDTVDALG